MSGATPAPMSALYTVLVHRLTILTLCAGPPCCLSADDLPFAHDYPSPPPPDQLTFPSWLQMVVSFILLCSGIPTGDFNPVNFTPILSTHKLPMINCLPTPSRKCHENPTINTKAGTHCRQAETSVSVGKTSAELNPQSKLLHFIPC